MSTTASENNRNRCLDNSRYHAKTKFNNFLSRVNKKKNCFRKIVLKLRQESLLLRFTYLFLFKILVKIL